jgi:hypothetical protein
VAKVGTSNTDRTISLEGCSAQVKKIVRCLTALYIKLTSTPKRDPKWGKLQNLLFKIARNLTDTNRVHLDRVTATSAYSVGVCRFRSWQGCVIQKKLRTIDMLAVVGVPVVIDGSAIGDCN